MAESYQHVMQEEDDDEVNEEESLAQFPFKKQNNTLPLYGNKESMNINSMILTNIVQSPYFKQDLYQLKTFHEVVDEIYYRVEHLEPWEKNSRKLAGQVGMCAGVRGVAAGGIVSTPFCLLYKLFTLKLTRKQVNVMLNHTDSPHIRGLGFLYIRYCQPPKDFWDWFYPFLEDEEEIELRAGGGLCVTIGEMCRMLLTRQDWFGTMFPRLPVNVQKTLEEKLKDIKKPTRMASQSKDEEVVDARDRQSELSRDRSRDSQRSSHVRSDDRRRDDSRERRRERDSRRRSRSRDRDRDYRRREKDSSYDRNHRRHHSRSRSRERRRYRSRSPERRRRYRSRS